MSGFDTHDHDEDWHLIEGAFAVRYAGQEWPERCAAMHLRWLLIERWLKRMKPGAFPTVRALAEKWGWKTDRASRFIAATDTLPDGTEVVRWQDPARRMSLEDLRGDRAIGANKFKAPLSSDGGQTAVRRASDGGQTVETDERQESEPEPDGGQTAVRRASDGGQTPRASSPRASTDHRSHPTTKASSAAPAAPTGAKHERLDAVSHPGHAHPDGGGGAGPARVVAADRRGPNPRGDGPSVVPGGRDGRHGANAGPRRGAQPLALLEVGQAKGKVPGFKAAIAAFEEEWTTAFGTVVPWRWKGQHPDGSRVTQWCEMAHVTADDVPGGTLRIRGAARAYFAAVRAGTSFPRGDPATVNWFTRDLAKWLQTNPDARELPASGARIGKTEGLLRHLHQRLQESADAQ